MTSFVYICSAIAAINAANLGYDQGVSAGISEALRNGDGLTLSKVQLEFFIGILAFTSLIGALCMGPLADRYGRRFVFLLSSGIFITGITVLLLSTNYGVLMLGRAILGLGIGIGLAIDPMYISEISPPEKRGFLVSCSEFSINVGILLGYCAGYAFRTTPGNMEWRSMIIVGYILPMILLLLVTFVLPESPRWLVKKNKIDDAKAVLHRLIETPNTEKGQSLSNITGGSSEVVGDSIIKVSLSSSNIDEIESSVDAAIELEEPRKPRTLDEAVDAAVEAIQLDLEIEEKAAQGTTYYSLIMNGGANRRKLIVGVGTAIAQQITAEEAILYYMIFIFEEAGIHSTTQQFQALMLVGAAKVSAIAVAGYCLDTYGRRPMLMLSNVGIAFALFMLAVTGSASPGASFAAVVIYVVSFSLGMGPSAWLIASEVFTVDMRAKGMSMCTFSNRVTALVITTSFLSFESATASGAFGFFAVVAICCVFFFYRFMPETKGKALEEVAELFETPDRGCLPLSRSDAEASHAEGGREVVKGGDGPVGNPLTATIQQDPTEAPSSKSPGFKEKLLSDG